MKKRELQQQIEGLWNALNAALAVNDRAIASLQQRVHALEQRDKHPVEYWRHIEFAPTAASSVGHVPHRDATYCGCEHCQTKKGL